MFEIHECPTGAKLRKGSIFTMNFPLSTCNHYSKIGDYQTDNSNFDQTMLQWWPILCLWIWDPIISSLKSTSVASLVTIPKKVKIYWVENTSDEDMQLTLTFDIETRKSIENISFLGTFTPIYQVRQLSIKGVKR